jgi:hypothetical protein
LLSISIYILAAFVFVPSVFGENIPTAEFGMISAEIACWDNKKKIAKFLMRTFICRSTFFYGAKDLTSCILLTIKL